MDNISVYTFTYTDGAWVCSEPVVDTEHKVEGYWDADVFHYWCKKCAATADATLPTLKATLTTQSVSAATNITTGESTMRFIAALEVADGVTIEKIGMYIALVELGADGAPSQAGAKVVAKEQTVTGTAPATFALDLTGIPADQAGTSVYAWAFADLSDGMRVSFAFDAATVNALVPAQQ